jgi:hypothetical protein
MFNENCKNNVAEETWLGANNSEIKTLSAGA